LVFSGSGETLLHTLISPQSLDSGRALGREHLSFNLVRQLHDDGFVLFVLLFTQGDTHVGHGFQDDTHGLDGVGENDFFEGLSFVFVVTVIVNQFHLLQDSTFAGFTSTLIKKKRPQIRLGENSRKSVLVPTKQKANRMWQISVPTEQKHLDLVAQLKLLLFQGSINLIVSHSVLLIFGT
jgi:hypothetical protein